MPKRHAQRRGAPLPLTGPEKRAAAIDSTVKAQLEKSRAADLSKIARLKALRLAQSASDESEARRDGATAKRRSPTD
jgi:hypothetical protein